MKVVVIGAVAAGMSAASKIKRNNPDAQVVVYEKTDVISFGACGLPYFAGGFFEDHSLMLARSAEKFREAGIELNLFKEVIRIDEINKKISIKDVHTGEVSEDSYDKLMISTGARSIIPPVENLNLGNVSTLKTLEDGKKVRNMFEDESLKNVVIIGGGFIGIETIEAAKKKGKNITLIQSASRVLNRVFDKEITDLLEEEIKNHGVDLRLNEYVTGLEGSDKVTGVITKSGTIPADIVIIATGVKPNTEFLKDTSIEVLQNGAIIIDEFCRTSAKDIYVAGDCASIKSMVNGENLYLPLATGANKLGRLAGDNITGADKPYQGSLGASCIKVLGMEAGVTGITEEKAKQLGLDYKTAFITGSNHSHYYPGRNKIYIKLVYDKATKVILGGQVAGVSDAVQRTNVIGMAVMGKMTTMQLGMMDFCYAPPFAESWDVLNVAGNVCK